MKDSPSFLSAYTTPQDRERHYRAIRLGQGLCRYTDAWRLKLVSRACSVHRATKRPCSNAGDSPANKRARKISSWDVDSPSTLGRQPCTPPGGPHVTQCPSQPGGGRPPCVGDLLVRWAMAMMLGENGWRLFGRVETEMREPGPGSENRPDLTSGN